MITGACMVPHPPIILPEVGRGEEKKISDTAEGFKQVGKLVAELKPDTIILSSPHTIMYGDYFHISPGNAAHGDMGLFRAPEVKINVEYDTELVERIANLASESSFPAGTEGEREPELDHGVMVPLYFVNKFYKSYKLVRVGLSGLSLEKHVQLGRIISRAVSETGRRVFFIASGDLSHKLKESGPYGFDRNGPVYDERIMDVMGEGRFDELTHFPEKLLRSAAECGHRSFCIMAGALEDIDVKAERLSHEDVFGVGYGICIYRV